MMHVDCSIVDCGKPVNARGWCVAHWNRWRRHGDPLGGKTRRVGARAKHGEPMRFFLGAVMTYEGDECLRWPFGCNADGYGLLKEDGRPQNVHRMVCRRVHGEPPTLKHDAAHSCGKGHEGCVTKRHLTWKTRKENMADKIIHGTQKRAA